MRSRGAASTPIRSTRKCRADANGGVGRRRERTAARREPPVAPQPSTFRRVAVFVPFNASGA
jgi:hypothetical protein